MTKQYKQPQAGKLYYIMDKEDPVLLIEVVGNYYYSDPSVIVDYNIKYLDKCGNIQVAHYIERSLIKAVNL